MDCFPNDFVSRYGYKNCKGAHFALCYTGVTILAFGCSVLWKSWDQTKDELSTTEAEYVTLSTACKYLLPNVVMVHVHGPSVRYFLLFSAQLILILFCDLCIKKLHYQ